MAPAPSGADVFERAKLQQTEPVRLLEGPFEAPLVDRFGEVEERASDGGDGNPIDSGPFDLIETSLVNRNSMPRARTSDCDIDRTGTGANKSP